MVPTTDSRNNTVNCTTSKDEIISEDLDKKICCAKFIKAIKNITLEPVMFCFIFPSVFSSIALTNLNLDKACRVDLEYDSIICEAISNGCESEFNKNEEIEVQKLVASIGVIRNILYNLIPALLLLFIGSWSDRNQKRLPCLRFPMFGEICAMAGFIVATYFFYELKAIYNIIFDCLPGLFGGWTSFLLGANSYISDITVEDTRTMRLGIINTCFSVSIPIGASLSGLLYGQIGYYGEFSIALGVVILGMLYLTFVVKEVPRSSIHSNVDSKKKNFVKDFFNIKELIFTFRTIFRKRERNIQFRLILCFIVVLLISAPTLGESSLTYIFARYRFGWNEMEYSYYYIFLSACQTFFSLCGVTVLSKYFKLDDCLIGAIGCVGKLIGSMNNIFATEGKYFYIGAIFDGLYPLAIIAIRTVFSKLVASDELGRVFSLFGLSEALVPIIFGTIYSYLYKETIGSFPNAYFILSGCIASVAFLIYIWLYKESEKHGIPQV